MSINVIAGLDIGNGYVKGSASSGNGDKPTSIDFISGVAYETNPAVLKVTGDAVASTVANIFNVIFRFGPFLLGTFLIILYLILFVLEV